MHSDQQTPDEPVVLQFAQTPADVVAGYYASQRTTPVLAWTIVIYVEIVMIGALVVWFVLLGSYVMPAIGTLLIIYLCSRNVINSWRLGRWFRRKFGDRLATTVKVSPDEIATKDGLGNQSTIAWSMIEKVLRFDKGFLLFTNPRSHVVIPLRAFATPADLERFVEYAKTGAGDYVDKS